MTRLLVLIAGLALATSAAAGGKGIDYAAYASGESLKEIKFFQLYNWQRSTDKTVVLWTKPSQAYMITLVHDCDALRGSRMVIQAGGVAGMPGRLRVNEDLLVGQMRCRVADIQALDLAAMKQDRAAKKG